MKILIKNSAYKHGVSDVAIRTCLLNFRRDVMLVIEPEKRLFIGFDHCGNPLEVIAIAESDVLVVIHAMKLRKQFYQLLLEPRSFI
ncbi:MAG: hypothetical protein Ta2A_04740 [Treponemataceae bacterium]|nr:MAG: hypothetical protein Ta2A_04740 [Treponemataceae bacterium]